MKEIGLIMIGALIVCLSFELYNIKNEIKKTNILLEQILKK